MRCLSTLTVIPVLLILAILSAPAEADWQTSGFHCPDKSPQRGIESNRISLTIPNDGRPMPLDCSGSLFAATSAAPARSSKSFTWTSSELFHLPAYFEDVPLERYGQTICPVVQPAISAAHFFGTLPILPYKMGLDHPRRPVSSFGYYRPGSPTPPTRYHLPWNRHGALLESGAWIGAVMLLP